MERAGYLPALHHSSHSLSYSLKQILLKRRSLLICVYFASFAEIIKMKSRAL